MDKPHRGIMRAIVDLIRQGLDPDAAAWEAWSQRRYMKLPERRVRLSRDHAITACEKLLKKGRNGTQVKRVAKRDGVNIKSIMDEPHAGLTKCIIDLIRQGLDPDAAAWEAWSQRRYMKLPERRVRLSRDRGITACCELLKKRKVVTRPRLRLIVNNKWRSR